MKKLVALFVLAVSVSVASAQTAPKATGKAEVKKECKKSNKCCSADKEKTASAAVKTPVVKKN